MTKKNNSNKKRCAICNKIINTKLEKFEDEEEFNEFSNDGVCMSTSQVLEDGNNFEEYVWFCNDCHKELMSRLNIDPIKILHELEDEELKENEE